MNTKESIAKDKRRHRKMVLDGRRINCGSRLNTIFQSTNSSTSTMGQQHQTSRPLLSINGTGETSIVSPTNTLKDCLMENQINQRLFLNRRLNIISPQTTNPQQQLLSPGVNVTSTYRLTPLSNITNHHFTSSSNILRPGCSSSSTMFFGQSSSTHRASRRSVNVDHPIPMPNLDQFDTLNGENESINPCKSISSGRLFRSWSQNVMCGVCKALLWDLETNKGKTNNGVTSYSLCCSTGDVQLPDIKPPPMSYMNLFLGHDSTSKYFLQNIRRYNSMFSFTSLGGKIDNSINRGNAPYTFRLGGENYHSLGSLLPMPDAKPRFSQLYIYDTENEISNRRDIFRETDSTDKLLDNQIICFLKDMLDSHNPLVKSYRIARDCFQQNPNFDLKLRIIGTRKGDARTYNLPTTSEVAALIVGDIGDAVDKRDIIVTTQSGSLKRISELHPSYVPLQFLSACEAAWRIFAFDVHYRFSSVTRLPFHLPGQQTVVFADDDDVEDVLNKPTVGSSRFTGWMECNQKYDLAQTLTYTEFPTKFVWKQDSRVWELRKRGFSIGRIHHVPPAFNEAYFLRILLNKVKGPKCFEDIRKVDGEVCATYRDACYKRGLLDDDNEYIEAIEEASHTASGYYLRSLFATIIILIIIITYSLSRPDDVWENSWRFLIDGILYKQQIEQKNKDLVLSEAQLKNLALLEIQNILLRNNCSLRCFPTMPFPDDDSISASTNRFMNEELAYDTHHMTGEFERLYSSLTDEQCSVFNEIMEAVDAKNGGVFFVYGYGGTGKTFLWKTLSASKRSKSKIVFKCGFKRYSIFVT
ncbi:uncharacterized protein LOC143624563 [Bidens hawaiensis]|uniref:uncharacterized protein LOC143624563 n=1 Tax=Bidens hawaiensis TaxID=980011 RepID=UPI00404B90CD